jgi:hypothetical protein
VTLRKVTTFSAGKSEVPGSLDARDIVQGLSVPTPEMCYDEPCRGVPSNRVCKHTGMVKGIAELISFGPNSVANSLSCSNKSLDQAEELGG